jgi:methylmalonyl-CoA mutase N-terminal domain/subunit
LVAREIEAQRDRLAAALRGRERRIIGVTDFRPDETPAPQQPARSERPDVGRLAGPDTVCPALTPIRLEDLAA